MHTIQRWYSLLKVFQDLLELLFEVFHKLDILRTWTAGVNGKMSLPSRVWWWMKTGWVQATGSGQWFLQCFDCHSLTLLAGWHEGHAAHRKVIPLIPSGGRSRGRTGHPGAPQNGCETKPSWSWISFLLPNQNKALDWHIHIVQYCIICRSSWK